MHIGARLSEILIQYTDTRTTQTAVLTQVLAIRGATPATATRKATIADLAKV
jgi:hypothetical protein